MLTLYPRFPLRLSTVLGPRSHTALRLLHGSPSETLEPSSSPNSDLTVLYLTNSCGLSPAAALSTAKKLRLRATDNADSILSLLRSHGFNENQVAKIITKAPIILSSNSEKIIKPKLDFFLTAGLTKASMAKVISRYPGILLRSLSKRIEPNFDLLKTVLGGTNEALKAISFETQLLLFKLSKSMLPNIKTLEEHGVPRYRIIKMAVKNATVLLLCPAKFSKVAAFVKQTGFDPVKEKFLRATVVICKLSHSTQERKLQVYQSLGWSKENIDLLFKNHPCCLHLSEEKIKQATNFYVEKLKWEHSFLATKPLLLSLSLDNTIIPRYNVLNILEKKGLVKRIHLSSQLQVSEKRFLGQFVLKYADQFPELLEAYKIKLDLARLKESIDSEA